MRNDSHKLDEKYFILVDMPECSCEMKYRIARCAIQPTILYPGSDGVLHFLCPNCHTLLQRVIKMTEKLREKTDQKNFLE